MVTDLPVYFSSPSWAPHPVSTISLCTAARQAPPWSKSFPRRHPPGPLRGVPGWPASPNPNRPSPSLPTWFPPYFLLTVGSEATPASGHFHCCPRGQPHLSHPPPAPCACPATPGSIPSPLRCPCISFPEGPALKSQPLCPCFTLGTTVLSASPSPVYCPRCPGSQQAPIK